MFGSVRLLIVIVMLAACASSAHALDVPPFQGRITDAASVLKEKERGQLNELLADYERKTTNQIFLLTVPTLAGEDIEGFAHRAFRAYKVGQQEKNNGVLMVVALNDRRMRIEVGYGLEGVLPDGRAGQIQRQVIAPLFREGQYYQGIEAGTREIMRIVSPEYQPPTAAPQPAQRAYPRPRPTPINPLVPLAIFGGIALFLGGVALANYRRNKRCPRCHSWGKRITRHLVEQPTLFAPGLYQIDEYCPNCGYHRKRYERRGGSGPFILPGGYWGGGYSGGSSHGGGGFGGGSDWGVGGGGDSGGGGASSDW